MGEFKPLLNIGGKPALVRLLDNVRAAGIKTIVVVTGNRREAIDDTVRAYQDAFAPDDAGHDISDYEASDFHIDFIHNDNYEQGMFTSVKAGIAYAAEKGSARALLFPVDVPLVAPETIRSLRKTYSQPHALSHLAANGPSDLPFAVPVYKGKNGHPLLIPSEYFGEILAYEGEGGLKAVRSRYDETLIKVETDDEGCTLDMDTPQDYEKLKVYFQQNDKDAGLGDNNGLRVGARNDSGVGARNDSGVGARNDSGVGARNDNGVGARNDNALRESRVFLVRHGQPEQHSGKIFLGQADVPLSDTGRKEARAAGDRLAALGARPARLYASDLSRAFETAEIIAKNLNVPVGPDKLFREMAMGSWDGELIEDIRRKFPEEYAKRGEDSRNYRVPGGENFYDLRSRVTREFYRILVEETKPGQDIVIVAHLGVIVSLTEELNFAEQGAGNSVLYPTGSVTEVELPL
jgi:probable phosphoglycerate mutase